MTGSWIEEARRIPLLQVLAALDLRVSRTSIVPCPGCGRDGRDAACRLYRSASGVERWRCHHASCGAGGDALDLVALVVGKGAVRDWYAARGWCEPTRPLAPPSPVRPPAQVVQLPEKAYLDEPDIRSLLGRCRAPLEDQEVATWLRYRLGDLAEQVTPHLAMALPVRADLPSWASYGARTWSQTGHRLLVPTYDHQGRLRGLRARLVRHGGDVPKCLPPRGYRASGLVLASPAALAWLRGSAVPAEIWIAEGEPQWLAISLSCRREVAVLGITSGSWTPSLADRLPDGARIVVVTDRDPAGDGYLQRIRDTLSGRSVRLDRWAPPARSRTGAA